MASLHFRDTSSGGSARFINNGGGIFDISGLVGGNDRRLDRGRGQLFARLEAAHRGGNDLSTTVSGVIADGGGGGGTGGSLIKTGAGTLTLTGINTYTGATTIDAGTLVLSGSGDIASSSSVNNHGTLQFRNSTTAASGIANSELAVADTAGGSATFANNATLHFNDASTAGIASHRHQRWRPEFLGTSTAGSATITNNA